MLQSFGSLPLVQRGHKIAFKQARRAVNNYMAEALAQQVLSFACRVHGKPIVLSAMTPSMLPELGGSWFSVPGYH